MFRVQGSGLAVAASFINSDNPDNIDNSDNSDNIDNTEKIEPCHALYPKSKIVYFKCDDCHCASSGCLDNFVHSQKL